MKTNNFNLNLFVIVILAFALFFACGDKSTGPDDHGELEVTLEYTPNPATANTEISFTFEIEEDGEHKAVTDFSSEIEKEGTGNHEGMTLTDDAAEVGHYFGAHTFTEAGTYEIHFEFMHDGEAEEEQFKIVVQ